MLNGVIRASQFLIIPSQSEMGESPIGLQFQSFTVFLGSPIDLVVMVLVDSDIEMLLGRLGVGNVEHRFGGLHLNEPFRIFGIRNALIIVFGRL